MLEWVTASSTIAAGLITVAIVWWQERSGARRVAVALERYGDRLQSSSALRRLLIAPLEGRWIYHGTFSEFYGIKADGRPETQFITRGIASFYWSSNEYHILLGYAVRNHLGKAVVASVNTGTLTPSNRMTLQEGDSLQMAYRHRAGAVFETFGKTVDTESPNEDSYTFDVTSVEFSESGKITEFNCMLREHTSAGVSVRFKREFY